MAPMLVKQASRQAAKRRLSEEQLERLRAVRQAASTIRRR
jgi:hypothetical protein